MKMFKTMLLNVKVVAEKLARRGKALVVAGIAAIGLVSGAPSAHATGGAVDLTPIITEVTADVTAALTIIIPVVALIWGGRWAMKALRAIK